MNYEFEMTEHSEFYKKMMEVYDRQIREIEEPIKYTSPESFVDDENYFKEKTRDKKTIREKKVQQISKTQKLNELKEKYPFYQSDYNKFRDRTPFQYYKLVSTKNLMIAEFVLKWEHVKKKRIHKNMAWRIFTELQKDNEITDEFLNSLLKEFEKI